MIHLLRFASLQLNSYLTFGLAASRNLLNIINKHLLNLAEDN